MILPSTMSVGGVAVSRLLCAAGVARPVEQRRVVVTPGALDPIPRLGPGGGGSPHTRVVRGAGSHCAALMGAQSRSSEQSRARGARIHRLGCPWRR